MDKLARKPSNDPVQEKLRQSKAIWNKDVSAFINDVINFKKLMNGWPSKFHMEKSLIKEPIPADPKTILGVLASDFQDLAQKGNNIIEQQVEYSKIRKQKQLKHISNPTPQAPDLSQQLNVAALDYELIAEGSSSFSRLLSTFKGTWFGNSPEARSRKYRLSMLRTAALLSKELKRFEAQILGSSGESIFIASKYLNQIENHIRFINSALIAYGDSVTSTPIASPAQQDPDKDIAEKMVDDFRKNYANFTDLDRDLSEKLSSLVLQMMDPESKQNVYKDVINTYKAILADINQKRGINASSLKEVLLNKSAALNVVADNIIKKWVGKARHNLIPFDKTSPIRLDVSKASEETRSVLDKLMNSLEKGINQSEIAGFIKEINLKLAQIKEFMRPLEDTIRGQLFDKPFMDLLQDNKLTDYPSNLSKKEKERLERMLETRQFRDVTNLYTRK